MTPVEVLALSDEEATALAAEFAGWTRIDATPTHPCGERVPVSELVWKSPTGELCARPPDFLNDHAAAWGLFDLLLARGFSCGLTGEPLKFPDEPRRKGEIEDCSYKMVVVDRYTEQEWREISADAERAITRAYILAMTGGGE